MPGSASKYRRFPSGQLIGVLRLRPRGSQETTSSVPPVASATACPRVRRLAVPGAATAAGWVLRIGALLVVGWTAAILVRRLRVAGPSQRRTLGPLSVLGVLTIVFLVFAANVLPPLFGVDLATVATAQLLVLGLIPFAFTYGVLRGGFARTAALEDLGLWLARGDRGPEAIRAAVADAVGDPGATVLYRVRDGYVDQAGLRAGPGARDACRVTLGGEEIAAIAYDPALATDPAHVETVGAVVAIALDRERLVAELRASRARVTEAADAERRRIARDLHDGIRSRLVLLRLRADGDGAAAPDLLADLDRVIDELRGLVHGVMPAMLVEQGLAAALEDLADRMPLRTTLAVRTGPEPLPPVVQTTAYFLVAEALTNAVKHSGASRLTVHVVRRAADLAVEVRDDGRGGARIDGRGGLRGARDRVLGITEKAVARHAAQIYDALGLPPSLDDHRRVLAVVRFLGREPEDRLA